MQVLLSTAYLPPVSFISALYGATKVKIEACEWFVRQSFRNRAQILSPNGPLSLILPTKKRTQERTLIKDVRISYEYDWGRIHSLSIQSCYRRSPWFEFYEDSITPLYTRKTNFLWDYNLEWLQCMASMLGTSLPELSFTTSYEQEHPMWFDLREAIHPKRSVPGDQIPYDQVFAKNQFHKGLSFFDLLMNQGRQSSGVLASYWRQLKASQNGS